MVSACSVNLARTKDATVEAPEPDARRWWIAATLVWPTVYRRFAQSSRDRVWARLHRVVLDELGSRGELDWSRCAVDSVSVRASKGGH